MKHARLFLAVAVALCLGACAQLQDFAGKVEAAYGVVTSTVVTPNQAYVAINAFDAVEATATNVLRLPLCTGSNGPACRPAGAREQIRKVVLAGRVARNDVKAYLRAHPGENLAITSLDDLKAATSSLQSIVSTYRSN